MKRIYGLLLVITIIAVISLGHSTTLASTPPLSSPTLPAPTLELARPLTLPPEEPQSLSQALLGHWTTNNGDTHAYFGRSKVVVVNQMKSGLDSSLSLSPYDQAMIYEITAVNEANNRLHLKMNTRSGWAQTRVLQFSSDRHTFVESIDVLGHAIDNRWAYTDSQQQP
jgi:hypothetical protein